MGSGFGIWGLVLGLRFHGSQSMVHDLGFRARVEIFGLRFQVSSFRFQVSDFRFQGIGSRLYGSRLLSSSATAAGRRHRRRGTLAICPPSLELSLSLPFSHTHTNTLTLWRGGRACQSGAGSPPRPRLCCQQFVLIDGVPSSFFLTAGALSAICFDRRSAINNSF